MSAEPMSKSNLDEINEEDVLFLGGKGAILVSKGIVAGIVYRIELLHARFVLDGIFLAGNRFRGVVDCLTKGFEVLVLNDAGKGNIVRGVVNNGIALIVRGIFDAGVECHCAPIKTTEFVIKVFVNLLLCLFWCTYAP